MNINVGITEQEKILLMCAFEVANVDCTECINRGFCNSQSFIEMGQDLLVKLEIIQFRMIK